MPPRIPPCRTYRTGEPGVLGQFKYPTPPLAVFQEELIKSYRAFLDTRRAARPAAEYREPTEQEWDEFQKHFELRKVELGTCGPLRTRTRLRPVPDAPRRPQAAPTFGRDHPQPR